MKRAILSAALAVAFIAGVSAQAKPNFTGTWAVDPEQSSQFAGGGGPQTLKLEGNKLTMTRTAAGNTTTVEFLLDGTPMKRMSGPAGNQAEITTVSRWDGDAIVTTSTGGSGDRIERRSIQPDGTLRIDLTLEWKTGPRAGSVEKSHSVWKRVK